MKLDIKDIHGKVKMLDDTFSSYLLNHNDKNLCRDIASILNACTQKNFTVSIVNNSALAKEPFFGMRIFPEGNAMDSYVNQLIVNRNVASSLKSIVDYWRQIGYWTIELDSRIFDRMVINFNPEELTAMLLHEVGHTIYSDRKIEVYGRAFRECQVRMKLADKKGLIALYGLYQIPLALACGIRNWQITSLDLKEELFADQTVEKLGYGEHLISAFEKIILKCGNSTGYKNEHEMELAVSQSIMWCNINVCDLEKRCRSLKDELYATGAKTSSNYIREMVLRIMRQLKIKKKERYTGNIVLESLTIDFDDMEFVQENTLIYDKKEFGLLLNTIHSLQESGNNEIAQESFLRKNKKDDIPSQLDVDTIFVEIDRMENHADRRYVLDLIYNQEEKIERFKERFQYDKSLKARYSGKMESMLKELQNMRQMVLNKRSFDKNYHVFVKYPEGYEG